jgi:hypothetical protein
MTAVVLPSFMLIDWSRFLPAVLVLWFPIALLHGRRVRYRTLTHDWSGYWTRTFSLGLHAVDFGRAMLGAWWLAESLSAVAAARGFSRHLPLVIIAAVLGIAVTLQTLVCKQPDSSHAPFAFAGGMVAGFLPPAISAFSLLLAIVIAAGVRSPIAFFPMLSFAILAVGLLLTRTRLLPSVATAAGVVFLPWLLTLLFPRELVVSHLAKHPSVGDAKPDEEK